MTRCLGSFHIKRSTQRWSVRDRGIKPGRRGVHSERNEVRPWVTFLLLSETPHPYTQFTLYYMYFVYRRGHELFMTRTERGGT